MAYLRLRVDGSLETIRECHIRLVAFLREAKPLFPTVVVAGFDMVTAGNNGRVEELSERELIFSIGLLGRSLGQSHRRDLSPADSRRSRQLGEGILPQGLGFGIIVGEQGVLNKAVAGLMCAFDVLCRSMGGAVTAWPGTSAPGSLPGRRAWSMTRHGCGGRRLGSTVRSNKSGLVLFPRILNGSELAKVPVQMHSQLMAWNTKPISGGQTCAIG